MPEHFYLHSTPLVPVCFLVVNCRLRLICGVSLIIQQLQLPAWFPLRERFVHSSWVGLGWGVGQKKQNKNNQTKILASGEVVAADAMRDDEPSLLTLRGANVKSVEMNQWAEACELSR